VDFDAAVVVNKTQIQKFVHEKTHARSRRANHLRQRLLADFCYDWLRPAFLAKIRQQQKSYRAALGLNIPSGEAGELIRRQLGNSFGDFFDFHVAQYSTAGASLRLGCNLAWGIIDAGVYLIARINTEGRKIAAVRAIREAADGSVARQILGDSLHPLLASALTERSNGIDTPEFASNAGTARTLQLNQARLARRWARVPALLSIHLPDRIAVHCGTPLIWCCNNPSVMTLRVKLLQIGFAFILSSQTADGGLFLTGSLNHETFYPSSLFFASNSE